MSKHARAARIESVGADGVFQMTLASEGEASDGDILSITGGTIPDRMPLLKAHWNDPDAAVGSVTNPTKDLKSAPPRLRAQGNIEMNGPKADDRRDLAHMIAEGHIDQVSIRWEEVPGKSVRRVNLPSDHPYFVDAETAKGPERWGLFFEEWIGREGSIVPLGADKLAMIGRADSAPTEGARDFWRSMADEVERHDADFKDAVDHLELLGELRTDAAVCLQAGASVAEIINSVATDNEGEAGELIECRIGDATILLPTSIADQLEDERAEREPEPDQVTAGAVDQPTSINWNLDGLQGPLDTETVAAAFVEALDNYDARVRKSVKSIVDMLTGKVQPDAR